MVAYMAQDGNIVVPAIIEDAFLYLGISLVGIIIKRFQLALGHIVGTDIVVQLLLSFHQLSAYVDSQREVYVAVELCLLRHEQGVHVV